MKRYVLSTLHALLNLPPPDKKRAVEVGMNPFTFSRVKGRLMKRGNIRPITMVPFRAIGLQGLGVFHVVKNPGDDPPHVSPINISRETPHPLRTLPLLSLSNPDDTIIFFLHSTYSSYLWTRKMMMKILKNTSHILYDNLFYLDIARVVRLLDMRAMVKCLYESGGAPTKEEDLTCGGETQENFFLQNPTLNDLEIRVIETLMKHPGVSDDTLGRLMKTTRYRASTTRKRLRERGYLHETYWVDPSLLGVRGIVYIHLDLDPDISAEELLTLSKEATKYPAIFLMAGDPLRAAVLSFSFTNFDARKMAKLFRKYYPHNHTLSGPPSFRVFDLRSDETRVELHYGSR